MKRFQEDYFERFLLTDRIWGLKLLPHLYTCCQEQSEYNSFRCMPVVQNPGFKMQSEIALNFFLLLFLGIRLLKKATLVFTSYQGNVFVRNCVLGEDTYTALLMPYIPARPAADLPQMAHEVNMLSSRPNQSTL